MAKSGPRPRAQEQGAVKDQLIVAAIDVLREEGVVGASARAIASRAGVNSAAVFYHFGSVNDLLLAALDRSTHQRLERYREATADVADLPRLLTVLAMLNREDHADGHIAVMATMVGGGASIPGLGEAIAVRVTPWVDLAAAVVARVARAHGVQAFVNEQVVARLVVSTFLGIELLGQLEGAHGRYAEIADEMEGMARVLEPFVVQPGDR